MHSVRFNLELAQSFTQEELETRIDNSPLLSRTNTFDSNVIFERGRRYGFQGRIFSQAVVVANNILIAPNSVKGWAFIPQEGNTLISTLHAFLIQTRCPDTKKIMNTLAQDLILSE